VKKLLFLLICIEGAIQLWLAGSFRRWLHDIEFSTFDGWVIMPTVLLLLSLLAKSKECLFSRVIPICGIAMGLIVISLYYSAHTYEGGDGQAALIYAVMPFYQLLVLLGVFGVGLLITRLSRRRENNT